MAVDYINNYYLAIFQDCTNVPTQAPSTITGPTTICAGDSGLTYWVHSDTSYLDVQWLLPLGASIQSEQGDTLITVQFGTQAGNVIALGRNACGTSPPTSLAVSFWPGADPVLSAADSAICVADSVLLSATGAQLYQWPDGSSGAQWYAPGPGSYAVVGSNSQGCSLTSDSLVISALPSPTLSFTGPTSLDLDSIATYTSVTSEPLVYWDLIGGSVITGQSTPVVQVQWTSPGTHPIWAQVTNSAWCTTSDTLFVEVINTIGIQEQALVPLQVYPNPASTQVTVVPAGQWRPGMGYVVLNALGQEVLFGALPASGVQPMELSTRSLSAGVYTLQTTLDGKIDAVVRLVVER